MEHSCFDSSGVQHGVQAAADQEPACTKTLTELSAATIIYNPDDTISGRPQYGPDSAIPTPNGGTVIYRPPNTEIGPNGGIAQPGGSTQPGAPARPGNSHWAPSPNMVGPEAPTPGAPAFGNYPWNRPRGGSANYTAAQADDIRRSLTGDFNPDRYYGIYVLNPHLPILSSIVPGIALPLPLGAIGGAYFGSGAVPYWLDGKFARPQTQEEFLKKTDAQLKASGRNGDELIRLRNELQNKVNSGAPLVEQNELMRQVDNLSGPGGFVGNWWRRNHSPLLAEVDLARTQTDSIGAKLHEAQKKLADAQTDESNARGQYERANQLLSGASEPREYYTKAGLPSKTLRAADAWATKNIDLTDAQVLKAKSGYGLFGQALVQQKRLLALSELQRNDPGNTTAARELFEKFDPELQSYLRRLTGTPDTEVPMIAQHDVFLKANAPIGEKVSFLQDLDYKLRAHEDIDLWRSKVISATVSPGRDWGEDHFLTAQDSAILLGGGSGKKAVTGVIPTREALYSAQTEVNRHQADITSARISISEKNQDIAALTKPETRELRFSDKVPKRLSTGAVDSENLVQTGPRYVLKGRESRAAGAAPMETGSEGQGKFEKLFNGFYGDNAVNRVAGGLAVVGAGIGLDAIGDSVVFGGSPLAKAKVVQSAEGPLAAWALMSDTNPVTKAVLFTGAVIGPKLVDKYQFKGGISEPFSDILKPTSIQGAAMALGWALPFRKEAKYARAAAVLGGWFLGGPALNSAVYGIEHFIPGGEKLDPLFKFMGLGSTQGARPQLEALNSSIKNYDGNRSAEGFQKVAADATTLAKQNWAALDLAADVYRKQFGNNASAAPVSETSAALLTGRADYWLDAGTDVEPQGAQPPHDTSAWRTWPQRTLAGLGLDLGGQALGMYAGGHNADNNGYVQAAALLSAAQQSYTQAGRTAEAQRVQQELEIVKSRIGQICEGQHDIRGAYDRLMQAISPKVGNPEASVPLDKLETFIGTVRQNVRNHASEPNAQIKAKLYRDLALLDAVEATYHAQQRGTTAGGDDAAAYLAEAQTVINAARQLDPQARDLVAIEQILTSLGVPVGEAQQTQRTSPIGAPFGAN